MALYLISLLISSILSQCLSNHGIGCLIIKVRFIVFPLQEDVTDRLPAYGGWGSAAEEQGGVAF